MTKYRCSSCGEMHDGPPLSYAFRAPVYWKSEFKSRPGCKLEAEICVIDSAHFFIRGNIELPLLDGEGKFVWTVWASLSQSNFDRAVALWSKSSRVDEPPYFGWLSNSLPTYADTLNLKVNVHTMELGARPLVELEPTSHPLSLEQRDGIGYERIVTLAEQAQHQG